MFVLFIKFKVAVYIEITIMIIKNKI